MNTKDCSRITKSRCLRMKLLFYVLDLSNVTHPTVILFIIHISRHVQYRNVTSYDLTVTLKLFNIVQ